MKTLNDYLNLNYKMEIVKDDNEGGYVISLPELPGCISSGETIDEAMSNIELAKKEWISVALEDGIKINEPRKLNDYSGQFKLRIPRSLHKSLVENSKREGISMNQYCLYLLTLNDSIYISYKESIIEGVNTPIEDCIPDTEIEW